MSGVYVDFGALPDGSLQLGAVYRSGDAGNVVDDPIAKLEGGGNSGGIRFEGTLDPFAVRFVVLYTNLMDELWPDAFEDDGRRFVYYGDNKKPWRDLHDTPRHGNELLREIFHAAHLGRRNQVPPIFVFSRWQESRDVVFEGLAVPGAPGQTETEDLVAFWKSHGDERFLNYRAIFTMLPASTISRSDIDAMKSGGWPDVAPPTWMSWCDRGSSALATLSAVQRPWLFRTQT